MELNVVIVPGTQPGARVALDGTVVGGPWRRVPASGPWDSGLSVWGLDAGGGRACKSPGGLQGGGSQGWLQPVIRNLWPSFLGAQPCPRIPAAGVPTLPAQAWVEGSWRQERSSRPPHPRGPPACAAPFNSMGRGVLPEPHARSRRAAPAHWLGTGTRDVAVEASTVRRGALQLEPVVHK